MKEEFVVYVIRNDEGKIYIGQTANLTTRLKRHNGELISSKRSYTKINHGIWKIFYKEIYSSRSEALLREKQLKSFRGRQFIKSLV